MHPIRQSALYQEGDSRRSSKPGLVLSTVQTQMEMADMKNKQDELRAQAPARTWCLAATLCLVASITIVCTVVWATSIFGVSSFSSHHSKANESELYNEDMMKQYIAKRYPEFGIQNQPLISPKNKSVAQEQQLKKKEEKKESGQEIETNIKTPINIGNESGRNVINGNRTSNNSNLFLKEGFVITAGQINSTTADDNTDGVVTPISKKEFVDYSKTKESNAGDSGSKTKGINPLFGGLKELFGEQPTEQVKFPDYGPDSYFYSEYDANSYYSNYEDDTWTGYILEKIQDLHDWITSDFKGVKYRNRSTTVAQLLEALNTTLLQGDLSVLILKLKDLYVESAQLNLYNNTNEASQGRDILTNTSSATSFGLLTMDILLLRNLHLLMWDNQRTAIQEVLKDSEIFAMNALFMQPEQVKRIYDMIQRAQSKGRDSSSESWTQTDQSASILRDSITTHFYATSSLGYDIIDFTFSIIRAVANLGRAFRVSRTHHKHTNSSPKDLQAPSIFHQDKNEENQKVTELDCIWTVYCRNLDKATRNSGIFGFLAKLNSLALRLIIGQVKIERALDTLLQETFRGAKPLTCDRFFPKCSNKNAAKIILDGIIAVHANNKYHRPRH